MRIRGRTIIRLLPALAIMLVAGCQSPETSRDSASADFKPDASEAGEITPGSPAYTAWRTQAKSGRTGKTDGVLTEGEILQLPKFVVKEQGFVDFGFSVITNEEVLRGKPVKWVQIGVVLPDSIAERHNLTTGMKIIAIDNILVTDLRRDDLLHLLFERESGGRVRLLVLSRATGLLPAFVDLAGESVPLK